VQYKIKIEIIAYNTIIGKANAKIKTIVVLEHSKAYLIVGLNTYLDRFTISQQHFFLANLRIIPIRNDIFVKTVEFIIDGPKT